MAGIEVMVTKCVSVSCCDNSSMELWSVIYCELTDRANHMGKSEHGNGEIHSCSKLNTLNYYNYVYNNRSL